VIVEGSNASNVIQQIPPRPLIIRVEDAANRPLPDVQVQFTTPATGSSGEFADGARNFAVLTDEAGLATVRGFHPNELTGSYQIQVRAQYQGQVATAAIPQRNIAPRRGGRGRLLTILGIAGGAVAAVVVTRKSDDGDGSGVSIPTITLGGGVVGAPPQ
jgi:hypothetical protein